MTDKPNTARTISKVSQIAAVIVAGNAFNNVGCVAPCENINTFCTPKGNISPNANKIPCMIASNFKNSLLTYFNYVTTKRKQPIGWYLNQPI